MTRSQNYLLLDLDGAISPLSDSLSDHIEGHTIRSSHYEWFLPQQTAELLIEITLDQTVKNNRLQTIWSSKWEADANIVNENLEIPHMDFIKFEQYLHNDDPDEWFKSPALMSFVSKNLTDNNIIIIVDDEFSDGFKSWAEKYENLILIQPDPYRGLSQEELNYIQHLLH